jgi:hypothetical protein
MPLKHRWSKNRETPRIAKCFPGRFYLPAKHAKEREA